jgi:hypothetical protein
MRRGGGLRLRLTRPTGYHGYAKFFPLWALARYRNLKSGNVRAVAFGM